MITQAQPKGPRGRSEVPQKSPVFSQTHASQVLSLGPQEGDGGGIAPGTPIVGEGVRTEAVEWDRGPNQLTVAAISQPSSEPRPPPSPPTPKKWCPGAGMGWDSVHSQY